MKKLVLVLLCMVLVFSMIGCDSDAKAKAEAEAAAARTKAQFECAKKTYDELVAASKICEAIGDAVYSAWYFAIYEADEYTVMSDEKVEAFCEEVGISDSDLKKGLKAYKGDDFVIYLPMYLDDFNDAVWIVLFALEENGVISQMDTSLATAKSELKTMTHEYSDYSHYPNLKSFYTQVNSYAEFLKSPSGSFEQLKVTIENYETGIRTYKADLAFVFEE